MEASTSHNNDVPAEEEPSQDILALQTSTGNKGKRTFSRWGKSLKELPVFSMYETELHRQKVVKESLQTKGSPSAKH